MSRKTIRTALKSFGLTPKEAEIYIFLAKYGVLTGGEISKRTKTHRTLVYRILKSLQKKGVVVSTLESPVRFSSVPFEKILDEEIRIKQEETLSLEKAKEELISDWRKIYGETLEPDVGKIVVIEGNRKISSKISRMIDETKDRFSAILTVPELARNEQAGVFDAIYTHPFKSRIKFRFLTELSNQNSKAIKLLKAKLKSGLDLKVRNPESSFDPLPRMVIRDNEEVLFFISPKSEIFAKAKEGSCICTDNASLVLAMGGIFRDLWQESTDVEDRIVEIETGRAPAKAMFTPEIVTTEYEKAFTKLKEHTSQLPALTAQLERIEQSLPKLVGREKELWQLEEAAEKALRKNGNTILICGEAGIGKTRVAKELSAYAKSQNFKVIQFFCSYESSMPLWPVRQALEHFFNLTKQDNAKKRRYKINKIIEESVPEFARKASVIYDIIAGLSPVYSTFAEDYPLDLNDLSFFEAADDILAISRFLAAFSEKQPTMLFFDNLHLSDSSTLRLFRDLASAIKESHIFLVGAYRREALTKTGEETNRSFLDFIQRMKRDASYQEIELKRLGKNDSATLVNNILGNDDNLLAERIYNETEGNPFFVIETLKFLVNKKLLMRRRGKWKLARNISDIEIPPTIRDVVSSRIQILREEERDILDCASVVGEVFTSDLIENVTGFDRLRVLKKLNFIERKYQLIHSSDGRFRFDHAKVREVLYQDMVLELRREYHSLIGEYLEKTYRENLGEVLGELAHHYFMSRNVRKAVPYLLEVGRRSSREYAISETIRCFSQALELMKLNEEWSKKRAEIYGTLGDLYGIMAEHDLANVSYEKGIGSTTDEAVRDGLRRRVRKRKIVKNGGAKIAYYVCGEGDPTIFLLPSVGFSEVFNPQINYFSQKYRVVTLDVRGTGASDKLPGEYTGDMHVGDLRSVIDDLQGKNIVLISFSAGGLTAIKYVANYPGRVSKLVLWATNPAPLHDAPDRKKGSKAFMKKAMECPSWGVRKFWESIFSQPGSEHLIEWGLKSAQKTPPEIFVNSLKNVGKEDVRPLLGKINIPTLILIGRKCSIPHEQTKYLNENISGSILHVFEVTEDSLGGVFPNVFKGDKYNKILEQFITTGKIAKN